MNKTSTWDHVSSNDVIFHVTRNPYSRLYSVYIDKIYLPGFWKFTKKINERKGRECSTSVRFGEFLDYIMKEEVYDPHWHPVSELCGSVEYLTTLSANKKRSTTTYALYSTSCPYKDP